MRHEPLDDETSDRLFAGAVAPDDVPAAYARIAAMARDAHRPAGPTELGDGSVPASIAAAVRAARDLDLPTPQRKTSMLSKIITLKVLAIGGVAVFGATAAAASTGTLPTPAQNATSGALGKVGVSVPKGNGNGKAKANAAKQGGNSEYGHCNAFLSKDKPSDSSTSSTPTTTSDASGKHAAPPFAALIAAHGGTVESTTAYCEGVVAAKKAKTPKTPKTTVAGSPSTTDGHPGDAGGPADPGKPADAGKPASPGRSGEQKSTTTSTVGSGDPASTDPPPNGKGKGKGKAPADPAPQAP